MKEKTKGQRSLAVLIVAVIVVALIGIVMPLSASAADLTASQTELAEAYCEFFNSMASGSVLEGLTIAVTDIPLSWFDVIVDIGDILWVGDDIYYYLVGEDLYISRGGAGGRVCYSRSGGGGASRDDVHVTGDVLSDLAQMYNDHYGPKNTTEYISWRTDTRWADYASYNLSFFTEGYFCGNTSWQEVYLVPFVNYGGENWFSIYRYHFYYETTKDDDGNNVITLYVDTYNMFDETMLSERVAVSSLLTDYRYMDIGLHEGDSPRLLCGFYSSYTNYITRNVNSSCYPNTGVNVNNYGNLYYSSVSQDPIRVSGQSDSDLLYFHFSQYTVTAHDEACEDTEHDFGYYCYNEPIVMDYSGVDWSQFSEDDIITLSGDTFYDYTITNSTTGDSTTVYNYITNNYTYSETDNGDSDDSGEEGSGSDMSGNVLVSGAIDVGGQVDVNVNIEQSSSGSSSDFLVPVDDYAEYLPEVAPEVTEYLEITYSFLPSEIVGLLIGGIGAAVLCRILGR